MTFVDTSSYLAEMDAWAGASGACGALDFEPTGSHVIVGLNQFEGNWRASRPTTFYIGDGPPDEQYDRALTRLDALQPAPPATGSGTLAATGQGTDHGSVPPLETVGGFVALVMAAGSAALAGRAARQR